MHDGEMHGRKRGPWLPGAGEGKGRESSCLRRVSWEGLRRFRNRTHVAAGQRRTPLSCFPTGGRFSVVGTSCPLCKESIPGQGPAGGPFTADACRTETLLGVTSPAPRRPLPDLRGNNPVVCPQFVRLPEGVAARP